jgi:hypothetical protein
MGLTRVCKDGRRVSLQYDVTFWPESVNIGRSFSHNYEHATWMWIATAFGSSAAPSFMTACSRTFRTNVHDSWNGAPSFFVRFLFVFILDRVTCSGSGKCQVRTMHSRRKHKMDLDIDLVLYVFFIPCTVDKQIHNIRSNKMQSIAFRHSVLNYLVNRSSMFRSLMESSSGIHIKVRLHKTELAVYIILKIF